MAAKIIKFPVDARTRVPGEPRTTEGGTALDLLIEPIDVDACALLNVRIRHDASLAELHRIITGLFGWDDSHNYFFSYGSRRFEDPELFRGHDRVSARCRKIYSAADAPIGSVLGEGTDALFYVCGLVRGWELRISRQACDSVAQFG